MAKSDDELSGTKRLMGALVRMKPKPHEEMKVGKKREAGSPASRPSSRKKSGENRKPK
jgi:hypothetical protein